MSIFSQRLAAGVPGRMESHPIQRVLARPRCTLQQLDPEDLHTRMCDAVQDGEKRFVRTDEETFKLHLQFVRAHGLPKGQLTTFSNCAVTRRAEHL